MKTYSFFVSILIVASIVTQIPFVAQAYRYEDIKTSTDIVDGVEENILTGLVKNQVARTNLLIFNRKGYRLSMDPVIRNKTASFLVRIESSYYDEATKQWSTVTGLGSVVRLNVNGKDVSAVLSVSHLTQGQKLRIYDQSGKPLVMIPGERLANINEDVELILLKDVVESPLNYKKSLGFYSKFYDLSGGVIPDDYEVTDYDRIYVAKKQHVPILKSMLPKNSNGQDRNSYNVDRETIAQHIAIQGLKGDDFARAFWDSDGLLQKQVVGSGYVANARMRPGLSGAPLIRDLPVSSAIEVNTYYYAIEGLVQGHHRFENKSYFVGARTIKNMVESFLQGQRGFTTSTRWRLKNGMTFRDYGNGILETNMVKTPSSSFYKGDSGNAISVDGFVAKEEFLNVGMQVGADTIEVGRLLRTKGQVIPVLSDPQMHLGLSKDFEVLQSFGVNQDLSKLAKIKYQFRNKFTNQIDEYRCFYQVTDRGIDLQVTRRDEVLTTWSRSAEELQQGFNKNSFLVPESAKGPGLEISGLFLTDLSSIIGSVDTLSYGAPTITVLPFNGKEAQKIGCYTDDKQMEEAILKTTEEITRQFKK